MLGLTAVRCTGKSKLVVAPPEPVESARIEQRHHLEGLGA
jgi:hypothetical protein